MKAKLGVILTTLCVASFLAAHIAPAFAVVYGGLGGKPANPDPNNPRTESIFIFETRPNRTEEDAVLVVNNTSDTKTILVYSTDSQKSTDGSFACEQFSDPKDSVGSWIELEESEVVVEPGRNIIVPFTVNVPKNAPVGESNGCIMMQEKKEAIEGQSGVSISFRTGLRVVVNIPGDVVRKLAISEFSANSTADMTNIDTRIGVVNQGNVSIDSDVALTVQSIFGQTVYEINNQFPILRGDTSIFNFKVPQIMWGGFYKVKTTIQYDPSTEARVGVNTDNPKESLEAEHSSYIFIVPTIEGFLIQLSLALLVLVAVYFILNKVRLAIAIQTRWKEYQLHPSDTLRSLAKKRKISWKVIARANKIKPPYELRSMRTLKLPPEIKK